MTDNSFFKQASEVVWIKFLPDHQLSVWDNMTFVYPPPPLSCLLLVFLYEITEICLQPAAFSSITFIFLYFFLCFRLLTFKAVSIIYMSIVLLKYVLHFTDGEERQRINISLFWFRLLMPGKGHKVLTGGSLTYESNNMFVKFAGWSSPVESRLRNQTVCTAHGA